MTKRNKFDEVKIRLLMKLRKLSRAAAVAEIARMDAGRDVPMKTAKIEEAQFGDINPSKVLTLKDDDVYLSAEEFFKDW